MSFVIIALSTVATTGIAAHSAFTQSREAKKTRKESKAATDKLKADEEREREQTASRVRRQSTGGGARAPRSTILTSPLGVPGGSPGGGKTLLGQ